MKKKAKIVTTMLLALAIVFSVALGGCSSTRDEDVGDFYVRFYNNEYVAILGTTEQGNYQRFLVIPEYIQGKRVWYLGEYKPRAGFRSLDVLLPDIKSDVIEKVYFENEMTEFPASFEKCTNLTKTFFIKGAVSRRKKGGTALFLQVAKNIAKRQLKRAVLLRFSLPEAGKFDQRAYQN